MRAPLLCLPVTVLLAAALAACGDAEEVATPAATATPVAAASPAPTVAPATAEPTPNASPSAISTPAPVPADWVTFSIAPVPEVTFRYPRTWFQDHSRLTSFDPVLWKGPSYPPGGVVVDFDRIPVDGQEPTRPAEASATSLWGVQGWEYVLYRSSIASSDVPPWGKAHTFAVEWGGFQYRLTGAFAEEDADESTFLQIAATLRIK